MKDKRIAESEFGLSLNLDDSEKALGPGETRYALNVWSGTSKEGKVGAVVNERGNELVEVPLPSTGNNEVLGFISDIQNNLIYFFLHNSANKHSIYEYNVEKNTVEKVLFEESILNFSTDNPIHSGNVIEGKIYWVDGRNEARKINVKRAKEYTAGLSYVPSLNILPYASLDEQTINQIKRPPAYPPTAVYKTDPNTKTNYVSQRQFQFAYRYIYDDFEKSVMSPWSPIPQPPHDFVTINGALTAWWKTNNLSISSVEEFIETRYNYIQLSVKVGHHTCNKIQIVFKDGSVVGDEGGSGVWYLLKEIDNQELLQTLNTGDDYSEIKFYNRNHGYAIPDAEMFKTYDRLPRKPWAQEYLHKNRLAHACFTSGYDLPEINVQAEAISTQYDQAFVDPSFNTLASYSWYKTTINPTFLVGSLVDGQFNINYNTLFEGDVLILELSSSGPVNRPGYAYYFITDDDKVSQATFESNFFDFCSQLGQIVQLNPTTSGHSAAYRYWNKQHPTTNDYITRIHQCGKIPFNTNSFKEGVNHGFAICYYDENGRHSPAMTSDGMRVYVPLKGQINPFSFNTYKHSVKISIHHRPPTWATHYQILYSGRSNMGDFAQVPIQDSNINTKAWLTNFEMQEDLTISYEFAAGDYLRKIMDSNSKNSEGGNSYRVQKFDQDDQTFISQAGRSISKDDLIEFSKYEAEQTSQKYFEYGIVLPILNAGTSNAFHSGNDQNQNSSIPAITIIERGDVWQRTRLYPMTNTAPGYGVKEYFIESPEYSDVWPSANTDQGRVIVEDPDFKETFEPSGIRYSNPYFEDTITNGLNSFDSDSQIHLSVRYGRIQKLIEVGYTLKVVQDRKITSIFIGRQQPINPDGTPDVLLTDRVLGSVVPSNEDCGSIFPESVVRNGRHIYFFDPYTGKVYRDAPNGVFPISDYKLSTHFRNISDWIIKTIQYGYVHKVRCGWNDQLDSYMFTYDWEKLSGDVAGAPTFNPPSTVFAHTIRFNEPENKWKSFHSFIPDRYAFYAKTMLTFKDGLTYLHNESELRCNYYGEQFPCIVEVISNVEADKIKTFEAIAIQSNERWDGELITVPPSELYPDGMQTDFVKERLRLVEGAYYLAMPRDLKTPGLQSESEAYRRSNGRVLRGNVCYIRLRNELNKEVVITRVLIEVKPSNPSP